MKTKKQTIKSLIEEIASKKMIRIERWRDDYKHWRVGIEWYGKDDYDFVCEKPTLLEALLASKKYLDTHELV